MELGAKIKQARLEAGLSQRQLCGDTITRNMLSLIENGSAKPSMDTLRILAARLGKPLGWFLEEEAVTSANQQRMALAREALVRGDWQGLLDALEDFREPDETFIYEAALMKSLALTELARQAIREGRMPYGRSLLEQAGRLEGPYQALTLPRRQVLMAQAGGKTELPDCSEVLLLQARDALDDGAPERCLALLGGCARQDSRWHLLAGLARMDLKDFAGAIPHLTAAEADFPARAIPRLETAWKETGDFKMAYEYACKGRNIGD